MKKLAYFKIEENMTPRDASDILAMAKKAGYDDVLVYHHENADITKARYREQLLSVFRAAYRHKVGLYIADDRYSFSGTGFGQLSSVKDLWQKVMVVKQKDKVTEEDVILCERDNECVVATYPHEIEGCPFGHYPDLTNPDCAQLVIDAVYAPMLREYKKFAGYELKGFLCSCPVYDFDEYEGVPYSEEAVERYKEYCEEHADLFSVAEQKTTGFGWDEYLDFVGDCMEEKFVVPLKKYCDENRIEFVIGGGENSVSTSLGEKENIMHLTPYGSEGDYCPKVKCAFDALWAYKCKMEPVVQISPGMDKIKNIEKLFEEYPDCEVVEAENLTKTDKDCYILANSNTKNTVSLGFLLEGDWCVYDWEKDELYDFEHKITYTIYPRGFMCIVRKRPTMYTDKLPVRVDRVITWDYEEKEQVTFEKRDNKYAFYLPDEPLSDKAVMICTDAESIKAKLGAMEHELTGEPYIIPLFDFQRDAGCLVEAIGGEIEKIVLITKKQMG